MSDSYTKLFSSITESTVWSEPAGTRLVWITMLALVRRDGVVYASLPGLADRAKVTLEETKIALQALSSPDPYSRTKDHEGRRIEEVDGGWALLNYGKYAKMRSTEERREYMRKLMAERRLAAKLANVIKVSPTSTSTISKEQDQEPIAQPVKPASPAVITLPLNTGEEFAISKAAVTEFEALYPAVNILQTIRSIRAWCISNPKKRKTKSGVMRFVNAWLAKEQDKDHLGVANGISTSSRNISAVERVQQAIDERRQRDSFIEGEYVERPAG